MNTNKQIINVKIEDIVPNRFQPRIKFDEESLNELAASIKRYGIIQPLTLRQIGPKYEIIAGERRYKASIIAGLKEVPAIIATMDDETSAELAIIENLQREELSAIEEAKSYKRLIDFSNITQAELANRLGKSQSSIANKLRLLNLTPEVQDALAKNQISERHARSLLGVKDPNQQVELLNRIIKERLTVKDTDNVIKELNNDNNKSKTKEENQIPIIDKSKISIEFNQSETHPEELSNLSRFDNPDIINLNDLNNDNISNKYLNQNHQKEERKEEKNMNNELNNQIPSFDSLLQPEAPKQEPVAAPTQPQVQMPMPSPAGNKFFPDLEDENLNMGNMNNNNMQSGDPSSLNSFLNSAQLTPITPATPTPASEPQVQAVPPVASPTPEVSAASTIEPISPITPITPEPVSNPTIEANNMATPQEIPTLNPIESSPSIAPITPEPVATMPTPTDSVIGQATPTLTPINEVPAMNATTSANPIPNITPIVNENVTVTPVSESGSPTPAIEPITPVSQVPPVEATPTPISPVAAPGTPNVVAPSAEPTSVQTPSLDPISPISEPTANINPVNEGPITPVMPEPSVETPNPTPAMELPSIPEPAVTPEPVTPAPTVSSTNNVTNAINQVRDLINNLENNGYIVDLQELDLPDKYQLTISIKK